MKMSHRLMKLVLKICEILLGLSLLIMFSVIGFIVVGGVLYFIFTGSAALLLTPLLISLGIAGTLIVLLISLRAMINRLERTTLRLIGFRQLGDLSFVTIESTNGCSRRGDFSEAIDSLKGEVAHQMASELAATKSMIVTEDEDRVSLYPVDEKGTLVSRPLEQKIYRYRIDLPIELPTETETHQYDFKALSARVARQPIQCAHCGRSYIPAKANFACPSCGAPQEGQPADTQLSRITAG